MRVPLEVTVNHFGQDYETYVEIGQYGNERVAVQLWCDEGLFTTVTVNLPDQHLNEGEVFVKHWDDDGASVRAMVEAGWLVDTGREVRSGYVSPKVMRLAGPLAAYAAEAMP